MYQCTIVPIHIQYAYCLYKYTIGIFIIYHKINGQFILHYTLISYTQTWNLHIYLYMDYRVLCHKYKSYVSHLPIYIYRYFKNAFLLCFIIFFKTTLTKNSVDWAWMTFDIGLWVVYRNYDLMITIEITIKNKRSTLLWKKKLKNVRKHFRKRQQIVFNIKLNIICIYYDGIIMNASHYIYYIFVKIAILHCVNLSYVHIILKYC